MNSNMSEQLKYIVAELGTDPYNKSYNLISFDALEPIQLLQILTDVLSEIDSKQKVDVREEAADQTVVRLLGVLKILKYKPPEGSNGSQFRQGLVQGDKPVIYPILEWLLKNTESLKKRAYLARYLVKVEVPAEFLAEEAIGDLYQQYEALIEEFKVVHKDVEALRSSGFNTTDIKKDIASMEEEKEQLVKRVERLKKKVESAPNSAPMLEAARKLRQEKDRENKLQDQKQEQRNFIVQSDQRIHRLENQLKDVRQASIGTTPEGLIQKLEEENRVNTFMLKDKLPKDLSTLKKSCADLQRVVAEPAMGQSDLDEINKKIRDTNKQVNELIEKRMMSGDPMDDKLSLFRQQAAIIARKKEASADQLREARDELAKLQAEANEKRQHMKEQDGGGEMLKGEEFKRYVNKLRSKSTVYKKKRQVLSELRAENGVLARTQEILKQKDERINRHLSSMEAKAGVSGYRETQEALENVSEMKSTLDQMKGKTLEDISFMVNKLTQTIADKRSSLAPLIKELRPLRQQAQELEAEHREKKSHYDTTAAGLESNRSKLEQEVRGLRDECSAEESRYHYLQCMMQIIEVQNQRVQDELKHYMSANTNDKRQSFREMYTRKIQEQENLGKALREKQKSVKDNHEPSLHQMKMWRDFERLMEMKLRLKQGGGGGRGLGAGGGGYDSAGGPGGSNAMSFGNNDDDRLVL